MNGNLNGQADLSAIMQQRKEIGIQDRAVSLQWALQAAARGEDPAVTVERAKALYAWVKSNVEPKPANG